MSFKTDSEGWVCHEGRTEESWLDTNGHVNFKRYFGLVDEATAVLMAEVLPGEGAGEVPPLFFTLEARIRYAAELRVGESLKVLVRPLERTDKTLRALVRIVRTDPNPALSAECEWTGAYIDPETRRIVPVPEAAARTFDEVLERIDAEPFEPPAYPTGFELPPVEPKDRLQTSSGVIPADAIDRMGHVGLERYMYIFMLSNIGFMNALGMDREMMMENKWGKFVLGSRIRYLAELCEGDEYVIFTRMLWVRRKTCAYLHELYRIRKGVRSSKEKLLTPSSCEQDKTREYEEVLAGTCENTMAIADLSRRKIIPLPDFMLEGVERIYGVRIPAEAMR